MLLSEAVMFGTMLVDPAENKTFMEIALAGEEQTNLSLEGLISGFLNMWPWTMNGKLVGPDWSLRRMTLASPVENLAAIWDTEVRPGRVPVEKLLTWISLLENATDDSWIDDAEAEIEVGDAESDS